MDVNFINLADIIHDGDNCLNMSGHFGLFQKLRIKNGEDLLQNFMFSCHNYNDHGTPSGFTAFHSKTAYNDAFSSRDVMLEWQYIHWMMI